MMNNSFDRRKVLSLLGGAGATALAGCGGSDDVSVPDPEQEETQEQEQEQQTQEEQDELQEPPYEDRLAAQYAEQHQEAMQDVNQYTVDVVSKEGFAGPFFDGIIRVNEDRSSVEVGTQDFLEPAISVECEAEEVQIAL